MVYPIGVVISGPFKMKLGPTGSVRTPDVLFVAKQNKRYIDEWRLNGAADLVIEIIDDASVGRDRGDKFYEYQANGVREYWIADAVHEVLEVWTLNNKEFIRQGAYGVDDTFQSQILGNSVEVKQIFSN